VTAEETSLKPGLGGAGAALPSRVLLVEDNADSRETLAIILRAWGHDVAVAADGQQGLDTGLSHRPDAAVVDIGLPVLDGYEVARGLRAALGDRLLLIALTGYAAAQDRRRALEAGFNVHMAKPADLDELQRLLRHTA
jgi:CheY-like chemotaxis protein